MDDSDRDLRAYVTKHLSEDALFMIRQANAIIEEYEQDGMSMTLRQLHYQFVSRDLFENTDENYDKLGKRIADGRLAGLISWTAIEDRTRYTRDLQTFDAPRQAVEAARGGYRRELWATQLFRPYVGVEKDAMIGNISDICYQLRVPFCSFRGYSSLSQVWRLAQEMRQHVINGQQPILFHAGDLDPEGWDMTRDLRERLSLFAGVPINVQRIALNIDQVERFKPPPNYVKPKSSRKGEFIRLFGEQCYEMDSLPPPVIRQLIEDAVRRVRDEKAWGEALAQEAIEKNELDVVIESM